MRNPELDNQETKVCELCNGSQELDEQPCGECEGTGEVFKTPDDISDEYDNAMEAKWERNQDR